ncbi:MAG: zinc ribbon domain-containing protein [Tannerellaceae bacterium]|nr:zinc ribbon domain-containing protein [Tannerellaceae bacterium]
MEMNLCQSCGMPLQTEEQSGTNKDNSKNTEYCIYCFKDGRFAQDVTMDEMIDHCLQYLNEFNQDSEIKYTPEEARAQMKQFFPQLKRWKQ